MAADFEQERGSLAKRCGAEAAEEPRGRSAHVQSGATAASKLKFVQDSPVSPASAQSASPRRNMASASQAQVSLKAPGAPGAGAWGAEEPCCVPPFRQDWEGLAEKSLRRASEFWNRADRWAARLKQVAVTARYGLSSSP